MYTVFYYAEAFNQPLNSWSVASVTTMNQSELCVISIDLSASPSLSCVALSFKVSARVISLTLSCLFCVFIPLY